MAGSQRFAWQDVNAPRQVSIDTGGLQIAQRGFGAVGDFGRNIVSQEMTRTQREVEEQRARDKMLQDKVEADRRYGLLAAQEERSSTEWGQKQNDRTANREFLKTLANTPEEYIDTSELFGPYDKELKAKMDAISIPKHLLKPESNFNEEEKAQLAAIEAKQAQFGQDLVEKARIPLTKVEQIEKTIKNSKYVTPEMYAALEAAKKEEETLIATKSAKIAEERKALEAYIKDLKKANANDSVVKRGHYSGGSFSSGTKGGKAATGWGKDQSIEDMISEMSPFGGFGESDTARTLAQLAIDRGLSADEYKSIMTAGTTEAGKDSSVFRDNKFINPITGKPDEGAYVAGQIDELAKKKAPYGGTGAGGFYNKEDASAALAYRNREIADAERRIALLAAIDPTPKTREEKEELAKERVLSLINRGSGDAPEQKSTVVKKEGVIATPKGKKEYTTREPKKEEVQGTEVKENKTNTSDTPSKITPRIASLAGYKADDLKEVDGKVYISTHGRKKDVTDDIEEAQKKEAESIQHSKKIVENIELTRSSNIANLTLEELLAIAEYEKSSKSVRSPTLAKVENELAKRRDAERDAELTKWNSLSPAQQRSIALKNYMNRYTPQK